MKTLALLFTMLLVTNLAHAYDTADPEMAGRESSSSAQTEAGAVIRDAGNVQRQTVVNAQGCANCADPNNITNPAGSTGAGATGATGSAPDRAQ